MKQRKEWVAPGDMPKPRVKPDLHPRKTMICIPTLVGMLFELSVQIEFNWKVLQHPTYSPDLAPTDTIFSALC